jgi:hypothetical protein
MLTKTRNIQFLLTLFFVLTLSTGEVAFISFASVFQSTIRFESEEAAPEVFDPASLVQLWYDPLEPANPMIIQDEGRTVLLEGVSYSVVSITPTGEDVLYLCMTDNGETYVASTAVSFSREHSNLAKEGLKGRILLGQFIYQDALASIHSPNFDEFSENTPPRIKNYCPEISPPPPRLS